MAQMTYKGKWRDDQYHGSGTLTSLTMNGNKPQYVYEGEWLRGKRDGQGMLVSKHIKYNGMFKSDLYNGEGVLCDQEGRIFSGCF